MHGYLLKAWRETAALGCRHPSCALHDQSITFLTLSAGLNTRNICPLKHFNVGDPVLPFDAHDLAEAAEMELVNQVI